MRDVVHAHVLMETHSGWRAWYVQWVATDAQFDELTPRAFSAKWSSGQELTQGTKFG